MVQLMTTVNQDVNPVVYQPIEEANITFTRNQTLVGKNEDIGVLKSNTFYKSFLVTNICHLSEKSTITLNLQTHDESPFLVPLSLVSCKRFVDGQLIACDINVTQSGNYKISFTPHTRRKRQLIVQLGGVCIHGSPFSLCIIPSAMME